MLHPRFRVGMPKKEALLCWACMISAFLFPMTLGFVGRHKRQRSFAEELDEAVDEMQTTLRRGLTSWDYGFLLVQLHMLCIFLLFWIFKRGETDAMMTINDQ